MLERIMSAAGIVTITGLCVLLSEQNLHFANLVADRAYIIEKGHIRYQGTMAELAANQQIRATYLSV